METKPQKLLKCEHCDKELKPVSRPGSVTGKSRFCSALCANQSRSALAAWKSPIKKCNSCGNEKPQSAFRERRLVCKSCTSTQKSTRLLEIGEPAICGHCGCTFQSKKDHRGLRMYCNRQCANAAMVVREDRPCLNCGKIVRRAKDSDRAYCSIDCRSAHSVGQNNPLWRGGIRPDRPPAVYVGKRPGYTNVQCGLHRVVASRVLGRQLTRHEHVIHIDGNKNNNAPGNLFVCESKSEWRRRILGVTLPYPKESNLVQLKIADSHGAT